MESFIFSSGDEIALLLYNAWRVELSGLRHVLELCQLPLCLVQFLHLAEEKARLDFVEKVGGHRVKLRVGLD